MIKIQEVNGEAKCTTCDHKKVCRKRKGYEADFDNLLKVIHSAMVAADMDADVEINVKANCDFYDGIDRY
jgi:hypothetical protein